MISFPVAAAIVSAILSILGRASCHPVRYDQRQEGDLNFRTDIDDVLFVVVPPKDLISTGVNIVAATAANLLKNHYGSGGMERWSLRTPTKTGYAPPEKSPYKIDLEEQKANVKKISHVGDPNRYNFHENKNPTKGVVLVNIEAVDESGIKGSSTPAQNVQESMIDMDKNIKADEKKEPMMMQEEKMNAKPLTKKEPMEEEKMKPLIKKEPMEEQKMKPLIKKEPMEEQKMKPLTKKESMEEEKMQPLIKKEPLGEEKMKSKPSMKMQETKAKAESPFVVVGEFSEGGLGPDSIFALEGCGPDAYRDQNGLCVYKSVKKKT